MMSILAIKRGGIALTLLGSLLLTTGASGQFSATPAETLSTGLSSPYDIAISGDGRLLVTDPGSGWTLIYDRQGRLVRSLLTNSPMAIAVSSDGLLYIASSSDKAVRIYDTLYRPIGWLGIGKNEFNQPRNITIDPMTGEVYVIDQLEHCIKAYTANGEYLRTIDDSANLPQDAAIIGHELFVLDQPMMRPSQDAEPARGARIKVYDLNSPDRTRSFGEFGAEEGSLIAPRSIIADKMGYIYIADSFHNVVLCYDLNGTYVGPVYNPEISMRAPIGVAIDPDGILYVASSFSGDVRRFSLVRPPAMIQKPIPDIQVNDLDGPLTLCANAPIAITAELDTGEWLNETGDLLVAIQGPAGFSWYKNDSWHNSAAVIVMDQGPLSTFPASLSLPLSQSLPPGNYIFHIGIDTTMNEDPAMRGLFRDQVEVTILHSDDCR